MTAPRPVFTYPSSNPGSPALFPSDHVRMLIELLEPAGPDLARRWLAVLLTVPRDQREALVQELERRAGAMAESREIELLHPPVQREGYVEQVRTTYVESKPRRERGAGEHSA